MNLEYYKKNCENICSLYEHRIGFEFIILDRNTNSSVSIFYKVNNELLVHNNYKDNYFLYNMITDFENTEKMDEFLLEIIKYEISFIREKNKLKNFYDELEFYLYNLNYTKNVIKNNISNYFITNKTPFKMKNNLKLKFLLNDILTDDLIIIKNFLDLYLNISDNKFILQKK